MSKFIKSSVGVRYRTGGRGETSPNSRKSQVWRGLGFGWT